MNPVMTRQDVEKASKKAVESLYGTEIQDFKVRELFALPEKGPQDSWDVQVTFLLNKLKHTVDLVIQQKDGHVTHAKLIDTMVPL
jgi:hypothetical protein